MPIFQRVRRLWYGNQSSSELEGNNKQQQTTEKTPLVTEKQSILRIGANNEGYSSLYNDQVGDMTRSRKLARILSKYSWYFPKQEGVRSSLDDAWAYYEHFTLARYHIHAHGTKDNLLKAEHGEREKPTRLYPVLSTSEKDLADFGVGVGIYFYTVRMLSVIMLFAGVLSLPNLWYFGSDDYNHVHEFARFEILRSSAVCTDQPWKACPNCTKSQWNYFPVTFERYAEATTEDGQSLTFIRINECYISKQAGIVSCMVMIFVCLTIYALCKVAHKKEQIFDESQQTTSDYSVAVRNPPLDAKDPEEWHHFFGQFGHVTCITIALDNEELLIKLAERRKLLSKLEDLLPVGVELDLKEIAKAVDQALPVQWYWKLYGILDGPTIFQQISAIDALINSNLSKRDYSVSEVFVVYENETSQQKALEALQVPLVQVYRNNVAALPNSDYVFRGQQTLRVVEPPEPSSVRWQDLDESMLQLIKQQIVTSFVTVFFILCGCALVILVRYKYGTIYAAIAVSAVTSFAPHICQYIILYGESHASEGSRQISLYVKNTGFLWVTTALLTALITPFVETLNNKEDSLIPAMYAIFVAEMLKSPVVQVTDMAGNFYKHILAPRARSQKKMSYYFQGKAYDLSERYTDLTNVLFITFYYSLLFPAGYFLASATLAVHYWVDKFCLLRVWAPAPKIGSEIADMSRTYFFSVAVIVYAVMSSYGFASFPYDNACGGTTPVSNEYIGEFNATTGGGRQVSIEIDVEDHTYFFCDQDMIQYRPPAFPALPSKQPAGYGWMSDEQSFAQVYGLTSVAVVLCVIVAVLNRVRKSLKGLFSSPFESHPKRCSPQNFSSVQDISAYIPTASIPTDPYPVLFCDIKNIDSELIPWVDPKNPDYSKHNSIFDLKGLAQKPVFSTIHHWPPPEQSSDADAKD